MRYLIKINELEEKVTLYKEKNNILRQKIVEMQNNIANINWEGQVGESYKSKLLEKVEDLKDIYNNIEKYIEYLMKLGGNYSELYDEEIKIEEEFYESGCLR